MPNALVLAIDRLGSGYLGPYGNTWIETPAWNRLAARSLLFENAITDSPDLSTVYQSYWHGLHAMSNRPSPDDPALLDQIADQSVESWLITDDPIISEQDTAFQFDQRVILPPGMEEGAERMEQTNLARLFATVLDVLEQATSPFLIWVHAQAMEGPWDAPYELRAQFAMEEDPAPGSSAIPVDRWLDDDYDPDTLLGIQHAYGGQVALLDLCLGILLDSLWSSPIANETALITMSPRGYPLGEHHYVGRREFPLFGELLQVPLLLHLPSGAGAGVRIQDPVQPADCHATLLEWFTHPDVQQRRWGTSLLPNSLGQLQDTTRRQACSQHGDQQAIRVPAWFLRTGNDFAPQLYVKPDDRWEFNEVSDRCTDIVDVLQEILAQFQEAARARDRHQLTDLAPELLNGLE